MIWVSHLKFSDVDGSGSTWCVTKQNKNHEHKKGTYKEERWCQGFLSFLKIQMVYFNKAVTGEITNSLNKKVIIKIF